MAKKDKGVLKGNPITYQTPNPAGGVVLETFIPWTLVKRGVRRQIITPLDAPEQFQEEVKLELKVVQDSTLIKALGLAHYWQSLLDEERFKTLGEIAAAERIDLGRASRIKRLTHLAPDIIEAFLLDEVNKLALDPLIRKVIPVSWLIQRQQIMEGE